MKTGKNIFVLLLMITVFIFSGCAPKTKVVIPGDDLRFEKQKASEVGEDAIRESEETLSAHPDRAPSLADSEDTLSAEQTLEENIGTEEDLMAQKAAELANGTGFPDPKYVESRLVKYETVLAKWNELAGKMLTSDFGENEWPAGWHKCVQSLEYMVFGYNRLRNIANYGNYDVKALGIVKPWEIVRMDVDYLEGSCGDLFLESVARLDQLDAGFAAQNREEMADIVKNYMAKGDYKAVIAAYENLSSVENIDNIDDSLKQIYARALAKNNQIQKSLDFNEKYLVEKDNKAASPSGKSDLSWQSALEYADLLLASGQAKEAKKNYLFLDELFGAMEKDSSWVAGQLHFLADYEWSSKEYDDYVKLLDEYVKSDGRGVSPGMKNLYAVLTKKYNGTEFMSSLRFIMRRATLQSRELVNKKLNEADRLVEEKEFDRAVAVVIGLEGVPADMSDDVENALKAIEVARQDYYENRHLLESERVEAKWNEAVSLYDAREYEKAISLFRGLLASEYRIEAEKKIRSAEEDLASRLRKQAANLFIQAQKTSDSYEKGQLFKRSRSILLQILNDYPEVKITGKVKQNLVALEGQMRELTPHLTSDPF